MLQSAAQANDLPFEFFARLIWQESRFSPQAVGPTTRSGAHAEGIAQFMPGTAAERALLDPFDPVQALPKAAEFLHVLRGEFGNLGLAAAAYNAGPARVHTWLKSGGTLPDETRRYVLAITGHAVEDWSGGTVAPSDDKPLDCGALRALLHQAPTPYVAALEQRVALGIAKPWAVELAAGFSRTVVMKVYGQAVSRFASLLDRYDPVLSGGVQRSHGFATFYQARVGFDTRTGANALCARLRDGGGACFVLRDRAYRPQAAAAP